MTKILQNERPEGASTMSPEMLNASRYYEWTTSKFMPFLGENILDIGGGFGAHIEHILPKFPHVTSAELSQDNVQYMQDRFKEYPYFKALQVDFGADDVEMLANLQFDTIITLNVLEHIEDDVKALQDMHKILSAKSGMLCIQVPAHMWLYGSMDEEAGHFRRYTTSDLRYKLQQAGFEVVHIYYFNVFGVLPWLLSARILRQSLQADSVNLQIKVFNAMVPMMRKMENIVHPPIGQSVMAVAKVIDK